MRDICQSDILTFTNSFKNAINSRRLVIPTQFSKIGDNSGVIMNNTILAFYKMATFTICHLSEHSSVICQAMEIVFVTSEKIK